VAAGEGTKITIGNLIEIGAASIFIQARVLGIATDTIEIESPMNHVFLDGANVSIKSDDLLIDGSVTPQVFSLSPETAQIGDITRIVLRMEATADMDSGTFGPIAALTNGVVIRIKRQTGDFVNIINFKTNGDFVAECYDNQFLPNNGQGMRLLVARMTWAGQERHGVVQRLDGALNEELQVVIQDDLTGVTFTSFTLIAQGHEIQGD